jgi:DNA-binding PadR family transcriptional regulator
LRSLSVSIRNSILALLADRPMFGAQLRAEFESRTGGTWPLNVGQVYTTLTRLERDGLVEPASGPADEVGRITYRLTLAGQREALRWWQDPVPRDSAPRSELAIKLALAVTVPGVDVAAVVHVQRAATMMQLQELTRLKRSDRRAEAREDAEVAWSLILENLIFLAEAEVRWLDHVEGSLLRSARRPRPRHAVLREDSPTGDDAELRTRA